MCGIFFTIAKELPKPQLQCKEYEADEIKLLMEERLSAQATLSSGDLVKVKNADRIRHLLAELSQLSVKNHRIRRELIQNEIEELSSVSGLPGRPGSSESVQPSLDTTLIDIMARGPDYARLVEYSGDNWSLWALGSVLSLRQPFSKQPFMDERYIFQFNGELYNDDCLDGNDGEYAVERIRKAIEAAEDMEEALVDLLGKFDGEFAFVLVDKHKGRAFFGKDHIGKRSLLYSLDEGLTVASLLGHKSTEMLHECKPGLLYSYDINSESIFQRPYKNALHLSPKTGSSFCSGYKFTEQLVQQLHVHLRKACAVRQQTVRPLHPHKATVAILFSGGLDCTVLAALIGENYTGQDAAVTIDLLTVGFDNPRTGTSALESPDRQLSERSWYELSKKFYSTNVAFRLVQVDVHYADWLAHRGRVLSLIHPTSTEMDLSIAIAFYFASKPEKTTGWKMSANFKDATTWSDFQASKANYVEQEEDYTSATEVLFSGLGADELYGGYSRHESIFDTLEEDSDEGIIHGMYDELSKSLLHDITIIYERNLGRDDRAISSWGKELRYPYLDNDVVEFSTNCIDPHYKVKFDWTTVKTKKGEKRTKLYSRKYILRELARCLGLDKAADEVKRAIQFGAKSAKLEVGNSKTKGTETVSF